MPKKDYKQTEEHKRKNSLAKMGEKNYWKGKKLSEEHKQKIRESTIRTTNDPIVKERNRQKTIEAMKNPMIREKISINLKKALQRPEVREKLLKRNKLRFERDPELGLRLGRKLKELWKNEEFAKRQFSFRNLKPNCNGQKKIIELFGDVFHDPKKSYFKVKWDRTEFGTKAIYSQYGFKTLVIWDSELKNIELVKEKIINFTNIK